VTRYHATHATTGTSGDRIEMEPRSAAALLRDAAALVEAAIARLDRSTTICTCCRTPRASNYDHWKIGQQFEDTATKLRTAANRLDNAAAENS
jgi:hypothetical protein